ncbi:inositol phospholipid biosynthesis protein, partial [Aspergillus sclerotialis]
PLLPSLASDINLPHPPQETPVNYFARKNNIFNLYFVKIGWLWTTLAFVSLLVFHPPPSLSSTSAQNPKRLAQALLRFTLATIAWYLTTQWFFGPPIIDRGFILTGGKCMKAYHHQAHGGGYESGTKHLEEMLTGAACKAAGGDWKGGHDVSGHVFMLVLATAVLGFEAVGAG